MEIGKRGRWIDLVGGHFFWRILHLCKEYYFFIAGGRASGEISYLLTYLPRRWLSIYIPFMHWATFAEAEKTLDSQRYGVASGCAYSSDSKTSSAAGVVWRQLMAD